MPGQDPSAHATLLLSEDGWLAVLYGEHSPLAPALCNTVCRVVTTNRSVHGYELVSSFRWSARRVGNETPVDRSHGVIKTRSVPATDVGRQTTLCRQTMREFSASRRSVLRGLAAGGAAAALPSAAEAAEFADETDPTTRATFEAVVDAVIPATPDLAANLGSEH